MAREDFELGPAMPDEAGAVARVLQEAARWITTWRSQLWDPALLGEDFVAPFIARGEMLTLRTGGEIAGVMILQPEDPLFWPDRPPGELMITRIGLSLSLAKAVIWAVTRSASRMSISPKISTVRDLNSAFCTGPALIGMSG